MKCYFAPMEGITGYVYRRAHHKYFPDMDGYFTPFISPTQNHRFTPKELSDIVPEHNQGLFHDEVYHGYLEAIQGEKNTLFKMKELWSYMICLFRTDEENPAFNREKYGKRIRKASGRAEYETAVSAVFKDLELDETGGYGR